MTTTDRIEALVTWLQAIAATPKNCYYLEGDWGFEESDDYCWDCGMEAIGWIQWQVRLVLLALFDLVWDATIDVQHFQNSPIPNATAWIKDAQRQRVTAWALFWTIYEKAKDRNWWDSWNPNAPYKADGADDSMQFCECCGTLLHTWLSEYGVKEELAHWSQHPFDEPPSAHEAAELVILLESIAHSTGIECCNAGQLETVLVNLEAIRDASTVSAGAA